jgi:hypothetical protein
MSSPPRQREKILSVLRYRYRCISTANWNEPFGAQLSRLDLIDKAPHPIFPGFDGANKRMLAFVKMFGCMLVLGRITTTNVSTFQAKPQMNPGVAHFDAFFAHVCIGVGNPYLLEVCTCRGHCFLLSGWFYGF